MHWFLLNMPLAAAFFGAWVGIPLWLAFHHPASGPGLGAAGACLDAGGRWPKTSGQHRPWPPEPLLMPTATPAPVRHDRA